MRGSRGRGAIKGAIRSTNVWSGALIVGLVVVLVAAALASDGYHTPKFDLHDGGVWISRAQRHLVGRSNTQIKQVDMRVDVAPAPDIDVLQLDDTVLAHASGGNDSLQDINGVTGKAGHALTLPAGAEVALGGAPSGTPVAALLDGSGHVWTGAPGTLLTLKLTGGEGASRPMATVDGGRHLVVDVAGVVHVYSPRSGQITAFDSTGRTVHVDSVGKITDDKVVTELTTVGGKPVVLDISERKVLLPGGSVDLRPFGENPRLQQPGPDASGALVATDSKLLRVPLGGGTPTVLSDHGTGGAAEPVYLAGCSYGAWGGTPSFAQHCESGFARDAALPGVQPGSPLRWRVNRGRVVVNELNDGQAFVIVNGDAVPVDWAQALTEKEKQKDDSQDQQQAQDEQQRKASEQPPVARPDLYGTRPDRSLVVHPLENDTDPNDDVLIIDGVSDVSSGATVVVVGGGQDVQVTPAAGHLDRITFGYTIDDGRGGQASSTVTVEVHPDSQNAPPKYREAAPNPQTTRVVAGHTITHDVLADLYDPDGDPMSLVLPVAPLDSSLGTFTADAGGIITYTAPGEGFPGGHVQIPFIVEDDRSPAGTLATSLVIAVVPQGTPNGRPTARGDHAATTPGKEVVVDVLANDSDPDGDPLRVVSVDSAPGATISVDPQSKVHVTPAQPGTISVSYQITDGQEAATGTLRVDVPAPPPQTPPIAVRDDVVLRPGQPAIVDALANDIDVNGDVLVVTTVSVPDAAGLTVVVADHRFLRITTKDGGLLASTTNFTYTASDGHNSSNGTVVVRPGPKTAEDQPPRAVDDDVTVRAGNVAAFDVLANDRDPEGEHLSLKLDDAAVKAALGDQAGAVFPQGDLLRFVAPATPGSFKVPYIAIDPAGNRAAATVVIHVLDADTSNNGPQPPDITARAVAGRPVSIIIPVATMDPDGDPVTILGVGDEPPGHGVVTEVGLDRLTYTSDVWADGFSGTDSFTYRVRDSKGAEASATIRVGVAPPNPVNSPPVAVDDERRVPEGGSIDVDPIRNDSDPDGDALSLNEKAGLRLPKDAAFKASIADGKIHFEAGGLKAGDHAAFSYTVTDGVLSDIGSVSVTIAAAEQQPPIAQDDADSAHAPGEAVSVDVLKNDFDPDGPTDKLSIKTVSGLDGAAVAGPKITFTMPAGDVQIVYAVEDATHQSAQAVLRVPVLGATHERPVAVLDEAMTQQDQAATADVLVNDIVAAGLNKLLLGASGDRNGTCAAAGSQVSFTPTPGFVGTGGCDYVIGDGPGDAPTTLRSMGQLRVTVKRNGNTAPTFTTQPLHVTANEKTSADLRAGIVDPDPGDVAGATFKNLAGTTSTVGASFDGSTITVIATADAIEGTVVTLNFDVDDGHGGVAHGSATVTVSEYSGALAVAAPDQAETAQGVAVVITALANDQPDAHGDAMTIIGVGTPAGGQITHDDATITFTPDPAFHGDTTFTYTVDDGTKQVKRQVTGTVTVSVIGRPDIPPAPAVERQSHTVKLTWGVPAANGAPITEYRIRATGGPGEGVRVATSNSFSFDGLQNGTQYTFEIAAVNKAVVEGLKSGAITGYGWSPRSPGITPNAVPPVPTTPVAKFDPAGGKINVTWTQPLGEGTAVQYYTLRVSPPPSGQLSDRKVDPPQTNVTVDGLTNGVAYTFSVDAFNVLGEGQFGESGWSAASAPEVPATRPDAPLKPVIANQGDQNITVKWQAPKNNGDAIKSFDVEVTRNGVVTGLAHIADPGVHQTVITTDNGQQFTFRVRACNKANAPDCSDGNWSPASDRAVSYGVPTGITAVDADVDASGIQSGQARLSYAPPNENGNKIKSYQYRYDTNGSGAFNGWTDLGNTINPTISGLNNNVGYRFQVRACNDRGCATDNGATSAQVVPYGPPTTPAVSGRNNGGNIDWSWTPSVGNGRTVTGYEVHVDGGSVTTLPPGQTTYSRGPYGSDGSSHTLYVVGMSNAADPSRQRSGTGQATVDRPTPPQSVSISLGSRTTQGGCTHGDAQTPDTRGCYWVHISLSNFSPGSHAVHCYMTMNTNTWAEYGSFSGGNGSYDSCSFSSAGRHVAVVVDGVISGANYGGDRCAFLANNHSGTVSNCFGPWPTD